MANLENSLHKLFSLANMGMKPGLESIRIACEQERNLHSAFPVIHIAGTNGKGSTAAMVASILRAAGYNVGLYTSPHLVRFHERISINGAPIENDQLANFLAYTLQTYPRLTFFEVATLTAFMAFRQRQIDIAVLEVGLGGRFDATNVATRSLVGAITSISLDHTAILGNSLEKIAFEKSGIIKQGMTIWVGPVQPSVKHVIDAEARKKHARDCYFIDEDRSIHFDGHSLSVSTDSQIVHITPSLLGRHQRYNAALACKLALSLRNYGYQIPIEQLRLGIESTHWPGRLEKIQCVGIEGSNETYFVDGAHNEDGAEKLAIAIHEMKLDKHKLAIIFGCMADKTPDSMLACLSTLTPHMIFTRPDAGPYRASTAPNELQTIVPRAHACSRLSEAIVHARNLVGSDGIVFITGSLYLVGEAISLLKNIPKDPQIGL